MLELVQSYKKLPSISNTELQKIRPNLIIDRIGIKMEWYNNRTEQINRIAVVTEWFRNRMEKTNKRLLRKWDAAMAHKVGIIPGHTIPIKTSTPLQFATSSII